MPNQPSKNIKRLVVPVPVEVSERLAVLAAMERRSVSNYLQGVVLDHLEQLSDETVIASSLIEKAEEVGMQVQTTKRRTKTTTKDVIGV